MKEEMEAGREATRQQLDRLQTPGFAEVFCYDWLGQRGTYENMLFFWL